MDEMLLKIGEIAAFFNVSVKAVRLYEKKGIIAPVKIDPSTGYRYYTADQVHQINALLELKALGFSLAEIKRILKGGATNEQLIAILAQKRITWKDAVAVAENKMDSIDKMIDHLSKSPKAIKLQEMTDEQRAWLLVKLVCLEGTRAPVELSEAIWL